MCEAEEEDTPELSQFVIFLQDLVIQLNYFKSVQIHSDLLLTYWIEYYYNSTQ